MSTSRRALARLWFGRFWWLLDATRRSLLNLLFLLLIVALVAAIVASGPPALAEKTALVLDLQGAIGEQQTGNVSQTSFEQLLGHGSQKIQLRDVLHVLDAAEKDPKIARVVLVLDDLQGAGLATLHEIAAAIDRFKASGKQVIAWGSGYDQRQYALAAHANEVLMHPMGMVLMQGFGSYRNYYRDALDRLGISVNLIRVGTYKNFAEPYIANAQSPAAKEAEGGLVNSLWSTYVSDVEQARRLPVGTLMNYLNEAPQRFIAAAGDPAKAAFDAKLVDGLKTPDELRQLLIERGARAEKEHDFRQVSFKDYLARMPKKLIGPAVGVIVAEGEIVDGEAAAGTVGGVSTAELIRQAREDHSIKAVVLRINSPGGSAFGSELIRRELELTRNAGKPVVVSMGDVAASGGYWISMAADEVIADAATITGSIGVFALLPRADQALDKLGVHTDGVTTTWLGGADDPRRPLDPRFAALMQTLIDRVYTDFTSRAAQARKTTVQKIDSVAQGRVWSGEQAKEHGLIDRIGSYADALNAAATRAQLGTDVRLAYIERDPGLLARLLNLFGGHAARALAEQFDLRLALMGVPTQLARDTKADLGWLAEMSDAHKPFMALTHCLCTSP